MNVGGKEDDFPFKVTLSLRVVHEKESQSNNGVSGVCF